jgi:hypothetical protein
LDRRHQELANGILVTRSPGDGSHSGPFLIPIRTCPAEGPPIFGAAGPGDTILLLGGTAAWRSAPGNDWFGATVELWQPVWVSETTLK